MFNETMILSWKIIDLSKCKKTLCVYIMKPLKLMDDVLTKKKQKSQEIVKQ